MKYLRVVTILSGILLLLVLTLEIGEAASARVRCRVKKQRVRILVDGRDLEPGIYFAKVVNLRTRKITETEPGKEAEATALNPDVDLDFDSTAGPNDVDSFISPRFARRGDRIRAGVFTAETEELVAAASTRCWGR
ncbi:MAG: hypothetical protein D6736_05945 [Nitrospinota bacterium]|nr:MAG: hypothetical protein D6736_05945 [Nitrospinota bacterium]